MVGHLLPIYKQSQAETTVKNKLLNKTVFYVTPKPLFASFNTTLHPLYLCIMYPNSSNVDTLRQKELPANMTEVKLLWQTPKLGQHHLSSESIRVVRHQQRSTHQLPDEVQPRLPSHQPLCGYVSPIPRCYFGCRLAGPAALAHQSGTNSHI